VEECPPLPARNVRKFQVFFSPSFALVPIPVPFRFRFRSRSRSRSCSRFPFPFLFPVPVPVPVAVRSHPVVAIPFLPTYQSFPIVFWDSSFIWVNWVQSMKLRKKLTSKKKCHEEKEAQRKKIAGKNKAQKAASRNKGWAQSHGVEYKKKNHVRNN
jgi:hypothetical protein